MIYSIKDKIAKLTKELEKLNNLLECPPIQIGKIYTKEDTDCLYTFVDWNGEVRLLNITNSHMWKPTIKSRKYRLPHNQKVKTIPYYVALETWTAGIEKFKLQ